MTSTLRTAAFAAVLFAFTAAARAEVTLCTTIAALPHTIAAPGIYCLKASHASAGNGITINADDVVLDLNGHAISGPATAIGVQATDRSRVTVRNGTIRGFARGVMLKSTGKSEANIVERLRVDTLFLGIETDGTGFVVRDNLIVGAGNAVAGSSAEILGIYVNGGSGGHIHDNQIVNLDWTGDNGSNAIQVFKAPGTNVQGNLISNTLIPGNTLTIGIMFIAAQGNTAVDNRIYNVQKGIEFVVPVGPGLYMGNTVHATVPFTGGVAAGATNFTF
jgi:hypothetical protein